MTAAVDNRRRKRELDVGPPKDGTPFYGVTVQPYRWHPYSPKSEQHRRGLKGRWQAMNEFGGWENAKPPASWIDDRVDLARLVAAAPALLSAVKSAEAFRDELCGLISRAVYEAEELERGDARLVRLAKLLDQWMHDGTLASYRDEFEDAISQAEVART